MDKKILKNKTKNFWSMKKKLGEVATTRELGGSTFKM